MPATTPEATALAGFLQRYAAWSLDAALLAIPTLLLAWPRIAAAAPAWERFGAALSALFESALRGMLDGLSPLQASLGLLADPGLRDATRLLHDALWPTLAWPLAVFVLLACAWHVGFERSRWQASPGKRALGLHVTTTEGGAPSLARGVGRFLAGGLSWLGLNIGHLLAALPPAHRALHDRISGTRIVATRRSLPAWAKAWLWLQLAAFVAANAWLLLRFDAALQAALQRSFY